MQYNLPRTLVLLVFFGVIGIVRPMYAQEKEAQGEQQQLETIQQQLKEKQTEFDQIQGKERNLLRELRELDQRLKESQQKLEEYRQQLRKNEKALDNAQANLARFQEQYDTKHRALATRVKAIYKMGDLGYLAPLFSMSSETDLNQQIKYLQRIAEHDLQLMQDAKRDMEAIVKERAILKKHQQKILEDQQQIEQQRLEIAGRQQQKAQVLKAIQQDKAQFAQVIQELEVSAGNLEHFMSDLEKPQKSLPEKVLDAGKRIIFPQNERQVVQSYGEHFRANKGKLLWPVQGNIITNFGPLKIGETTTHYKGVDIRAAQGTPFHAVFKGAVKYANWFEGYGNLIILDHGGNFYTLYAHADEISVKPGDVVDTRQVLGKVGETDSLKGPHLYFEVRANGKPEDPQRWLAKIR